MARLHYTEIDEALEEIQEHKNAEEDRREMGDVDYYHQDLNESPVNVQEFNDREHNRMAHLHPHRNHIGVGR